jgi:hypothetical protein
MPNVCAAVRSTSTGSGFIRSFHVCNVVVVVSSLQFAPTRLALVTMLIWG